MENTEGGFNPLDAITSRVQKIVGESVMPTEGFRSTMIIYGGKLTTDPEGRMVLDRRGIVTRMNIRGDSFLRTYDDHEGRETKQLKVLRRDLKRHPTRFFRSIMPGPKRYRGSQQEIERNIQRLGLEDYYDLHPWGIEIKRPEVFTKGIPFQDIYRADLISSDRINGIDRFQALASVASYMRYIHDHFGAIGEGVPYRFIFQTQERNVAQDPVLFIPDIIYNPQKQFGRTEQKATDVFELLISVGIEELRRSNDWTQVKKALEVVIQNYADQEVLGATGSFAKRGRLTLKGWLFSQHNKAHLGIGNLTRAQQQSLDTLRQMVIDACPPFKLSNLQKEF